MLESALKIIKCPQCGRWGDFTLQAGLSDHREVREGRIICACGTAFEIHAGVVDMLLPGRIRGEVADEIAGWNKVHDHWFDLSGKKSNFWLIEPDNEETAGITSDEYIRRLPDFERIGKTFVEREGYKIQSYRELLELAEIRPGDRLLELGAARCWTARDFTRMGCQCVATDIVTTRYIGLETSDIYFEDDPDLYWERVRCDMEEIPFAPESFDLVFCNAVLHHSKDPVKVMREIWRVLAPGGSLMIVNEPDYGLLDKRRHLHAQIEETAAGANENLYNQRFFVRNLKRIGFQTHFRPYLWAVKYYAWAFYRLFRHVGITDYQFQLFIERHMLAHTELLRYFIGLGTLGVAKKPLAPEPSTR